MECEQIVNLWFIGHFFCVCVCRCTWLRVLFMVWRGHWVIWRTVHAASAVLLLKLNWPSWRIRWLQQRFKCSSPSYRCVGGWVGVCVQRLDIETETGFSLVYIWTWILNLSHDKWFWRKQASFCVNNYSCLVCPLWWYVITLYTVALDYHKNLVTDAPPTILSSFVLWLCCMDKNNP